jgi:hypothetical protein
MITITAKPQSAGAEYTAEQRRAIDARLAAAKKSPTHGPFAAAEAIRFLKNELKLRRRKSRKTG